MTENIHVTKGSLPFFEKAVRYYNKFSLTKVKYEIGDLDGGTGLYTVILVFDSLDDLRIISKFEGVFEHEKV